MMIIEWGPYVSLALAALAFGVVASRLLGVLRAHWLGVAVVAGLLLLAAVAVMYIADAAAASV
jgi:hypothetical protein